MQPSGAEAGLEPLVDGQEFTAATAPTPYGSAWPKSARVGTKDAERIVA